MIAVANRRGWEQQSARHLNKFHVTNVWVARNSARLGRIGSHVIKTANDRSKEEESSEELGCFVHDTIIAQDGSFVKGLQQFLTNEFADLGAA